MTLGSGLYNRGSGKYGNSPSHGPRCACADCNQMYAVHNNNGRCHCKDCVAHRETMPATPPGVTRFDTVAQKVAHNAMYGKQPKGKGMSTIHICERTGCESLIKAQALGNIVVTDSPVADEQYKDLCPACVKDIQELLHTAPTSERHRAYDQPYQGWKAPTKDDVDAIDDLDNIPAEYLAAALLRRHMPQQSIEGTVVGD